MIRKFRKFEHRNDDYYSYNERQPTVIVDKIDDVLTQVETILDDVDLSKIDLLTANIEVSQYNQDFDAVEDLKGRLRPEFNKLARKINAKFNKINSDLEKIYDLINTN